MISEPLVVSPIYIVVVASTVFAVLWGIIFKDMLEYQVAVWNNSPQPSTSIIYKTPNLIIAYLGMTLFISLSVSSSLAVFFPVYWIAGLMGLIVVIPTALLIWVQLGSMLNLLATKGYESIDIDTLFVDKSAEKVPNPTVSKS
ncbi:conserved membrane hypothetical protein [Planktothrix serta PCC 8927]|uniref:50S ribosomal protein L21 n=1 Tax=Planktothrix serta PCC 8927 TaxID=671068 RepID=A0A7Z9BKY2_9CYAN|nr:hypothetical protein [Planktothrix serta]VXD16126.1 conserved membrane hypothetical protein [Planktothrix serta PCC 8927]